jgi:undecaprenyl-diphosphatase
MSPDAPALPLRHALALGALHGVAELWPVSSSAHVGLVPRLAGWSDAAALPADVRKAFEVALHAGTLPVLVVLTPLPAWRVALAATVPAAIVGLLWERPIEQRLGGERTVAVGLIAGSGAMLAGDVRGATDRRAEDAGLRDALVLGAAQAVALMPGTSRLGMTLTAARALGFARPDALRLAHAAGLPVIAAATALKLWRLGRDGLDPRLRAPFAAGMAAAFATSALAARRARGVSVPAVAAERVALAALALRAARRR